MWVKNLKTERKVEKIIKVWQFLQITNWKIWKLGAEKSMKMVESSLNELEKVLKGIKIYLKRKKKEMKNKKWNNKKSVEKRKIC